MTCSTRFGSRVISTALFLRSVSRFASKQTPSSFLFTSASCFNSKMKFHSEVLAERLEKPVLDDREYRVIKLPNKLEALLIHDKKTDKASAAVDVNVGSLSDEHQLPGMAHAVEHMLFMGNEKYPSENDYQQYLADYSGSHNAFTAQTSTNYFFEMGLGEEAQEPTNGATESQASVTPFHGALDRFSQFFVSPLFLEDTLDRELRAVDSENKKNLQSDMWRMQQLKRSLSNPQHPNCKFSTGNLQTLRDDPVARGVEIRKEFMRFYHENYSANRMKLAVLSREPLDQLQAWAEELFGAVRNKELDKLRWDVPLLTEKELLTEIFAKPVMDMRSLEIIFPYPDEDHLWESSPGRYISHLIGHEGPGSILADLKTKGWANGLSSGSRSLCPGTGVFEINVGLTPEGLTKYQDVVATVFEYISILHENAPQEWIFDELSRMSEVDFRFKQKSPASSTTSGLAGFMQQPIPRDCIMSARHVVRKFDAVAIREGIASLNPDNFRLFVVSKEPLQGEVKREKWYGTEYTIQKISPTFHQSIKNAFSKTTKTRSSSLSLPAKNEFIPTRLEVEKKTVETPMKAPRLIRNDGNIRVWHKKDDQFHVPKANVFLRLRTLLPGLTPRNNMMAIFFTRLVEDSLNEYAYDAEIAGLEYDLDTTYRGLNVNLGGYNDKMPVLLEKVLSTMRNLEIQDARFDIIKERLARSMRNKAYTNPYNQVGEYARWLTSDKAWVTDELVNELDEISVDDVRAFHPQLMSQLHIEVLAHGNLYREDALKLADLAESSLKSRTLPTSQWPTPRSLIVPEGSNYVYARDLVDPANINHVIEYLLQVGEVNDRKRRAMLLLLEQMGHEPAFDRLRTKEQLGYVVFSGAIKHISVLSYRFIIQSERTPEYLEQRIEAYLRSFKKDLLAMTPEKFEAHRRSKINERLEKEKNLQQETMRFWTHISNEMYHFDAFADDVAHLKTITKEDMIDFFNRYIDPASPSRAKTSVYMRAKGTHNADANGHADANEQKEQLLSFLAEYLEAKEVQVDEDKLHARFSDVKVADGDQDAIMAAVLSYLRQDAHTADDAVADIETEGKVVLGQAMSQLGIRSATAKQETPPEDDTPIAEGVLIEDVHAFKASLPLTAGPVPVRPLSEFEELEPKL